MVSPKSPLAALILLAITATATIDVSAQTIQTQQQKLNDYRAQLGTLQREEGELRQQIATKQRELEAVRNRPSPEQAELEEARKLVEEARAENKAKPTPENDAKLKNAEFKYTLADRKFAKGSAEASALSDQIEQLQRQLGNRQSQIANLNQQISTQATATAQMEQNLAKERSLQAKELEQSRREAEAAQKEIERLKAMLAQKEAAAASGAKSAAVAKPAAPAAAKPVAAVATAPAAVAAKPAAGGGDTSIAKLTTQSEVLGALQTLAQRVDAEEKDRRGGRPVNEILHFKQMQGDQELSKRRVTMNALGNDQFRGEEDVGAGSYQLVVGLKYWKMDFTPAETGRFVFLLDYSDDKAPQLKVYKKSLEGG